VAEATPLQNEDLIRGSLSAVFVSVRVQDGVLVMLDTDEEFAENRSEGQCDGGDGDGGDGGPEHQRVPLPLPDLADEFERVLAGDVEDFCRRERDGCDVKDAAGEVDKRDEQQEFKGIDDVIGEL